MITTEQHLSVLSAEVLRDLGRNDAAPRSVRKAAIKILIEKNHAYSNHPDFRELRLEISEEADAHSEVENILAQVADAEPEVEEKVRKLDEDYSGPLKASFTTKDQ